MYKLLLFIFAFIITVPIEIFKIGTVESGLPLSVLLIIPSFFYFIKSRSNESKLMFFAVLFSLLSIVYIQVIHSKYNIKPLISLLLFFLPSLSFFLARKFCENQFMYVLKQICNFSFILSISVLFSIVVKFNGEVRTDGLLNGDFFGLSLSGSYGVHSLGTHYFILMMFNLYYLNISKKINKIKLILILITILIFNSIIILSLSRELLIALFFVYFFYFKYKIGLKKTIFIVILFLATLLYLTPEIVNFITLAWKTKFETSFYASNLNDLSSGRLDLQYLAIVQILLNPIFCTGFQGYPLHFQNYTNFPNLEGWSTHIYILTSLWKMGLLAFFLYISYWVVIVKSMFKVNTTYIERKVVKLFVYSIFIINLFWDALLAPNIMILFSFFCAGILARANPNGFKVLKNSHI